MADDDQQAPQQGYWIPYWTSPPAPAIRQQPSRPLQPQQPLVTSSLSRRQPQAAATVATRGAGDASAGSPQVQPQPTRLSSRPSPSPAHPLAVAPAPAAPQRDDVPQEKIIREPPSSDTTKAHAKAEDAGKKETGKEKKDKDHHQEKKEKRKEEHHGGKDLKASVADIVHKLGATSAGHASRAGGTTVITLAGENKGASMKISHAGGQEESRDAATAAKERRARTNSKLDDGKREAWHGAEKGVTAFVNSNVQVVNNSLVLQSSCSSSDPGVHLKVSAMSKKKGGDGEVGGATGSGAAVARPAAAAKKK